MFTGIIEDVGTVKSIEKQGVSGTIEVGTSLDIKDLSTGDSIAVDGVCLTVVAVDGAIIKAELSEETLGLTTLGSLKRGDRVNLERPLTLGKPIGGHLVTGHVDATGVIKGRRRTGAGIDVEIEIPAGLARQVVRKGSIAVDGISLTVADIRDRVFRVSIIPHTLKVTTLGEKVPGGRVNIETDIIGKYVERFMRPLEAGGVTEELLIRHGFMKDR